MTFRRSRPFLILLLAALAAGCVHKAPVAAPTPKPKPSSHLIASPLNGLPVPPASVRHRISAVMIDNYPHDSRPQSGLRFADVVYEAEAEGGITRYMALFLEQAPPKIGPVRSTRLYFVHFSQPYNPYLAHAGENDDVWEPLKELRAGGFADMEEILIAEDAFWRDDTRDMPHNLYTSVALLRKSAANLGWPDTPFRGHLFRYAGLDDPMPAPAAAPGVTLDFWLRYSVRYVYNQGTYLRYIGGVAQHDLDDAAPYRIADIIVTWMPASVIDSQGDLHMDVFGDFPAVVIRAGQTIEGTWSQPDGASLPRVTDASGAPVKLVPG
ncbi:MAG TPA: DUF3048 domain-containing protein, partial [Candidatus Eremiobacteraceae bacterium]|nr:DUF3048 domain-containing protein [Candidatus Eremiobacteraceae bacterium]